MLLFVLLQTFACTQGKDVPKNLYMTDHGDKGLTADEKVNFEFYYESLCPSSMYTYAEELEEAIKELAPYINITTYPYGNGQMQLKESQLTIECQHGEAECYGNRLHACAIDVLIEPTKYVPFNACMMRHKPYQASSSDVAADVCGKKLKVDSEKIKDCAKDLQGFNLLLHYGIETEKVGISYVPWWRVNGVSVSENEDRTLMEILCAAIKNPPEVCED